MLFPVTLNLRTTDEGYRMFAEPVREVEKLHKRKWLWKNEVLEPGEDLLSDVSGELFHIRAELKVDNAQEISFVIKDIPIIYDVKKQQLSCQNKTAPLKPVDGKIRLELLVDRTSIEIFGNDGRIYMPIGVILADNSQTLEIFTKDGNAEAESLTVFELNSTWK
jgi:sucrose-6-phosphate hydrolase SacC (GH32 family)